MRSREREHTTRRTVGEEVESKKNGDGKKHGTIERRTGESEMERVEACNKSI